jgi:plasmid replication initiation protein
MVIKTAVFPKWSAQQAYKFKIRYRDVYGHTHERQTVATSFAEAWMTVFIESLQDNITPAELDLHSQTPLEKE